MFAENQKPVDEWLRKQGIELPVASSGDYGSLSLEELVHEKEQSDDLIAEREYASEEETAADTATKPARKSKTRQSSKKQDQEGNVATTGA